MDTKTAILQDSFLSLFSARKCLTLSSFAPGRGNTSRRVEGAVIIHRGDDSGLEGEVCPHVQTHVCGLSILPVRVNFKSTPAETANYIIPAATAQGKGENARLCEGAETAEK